MIEAALRARHSLSLGTNLRVFDLVVEQCLLADRDVRPDGEALARALRTIPNCPATETL